MATTQSSRQKSKKNSNMELAPLADLDGKRPPQALEFEASILGGLMIDAGVYAEVANILSPACFYDNRHRYIYEAIVSLASKNMPIDILTVMEELKLKGNFEAAGGAAMLSSLTTNAVTTANIVYHSKIVAQKALARGLIRMSNNILQLAYDETNDISDVMHTAEGSIFELSQTTQQRDYQQIDPVIREAIERIEKASQTESNISGIPSGFNELDKITSGWQDSDLVIIAARPAMGKTAFVLSMAKNMAADLHIPVAVFSLEMSKIQLVNRLMMNVCEIEGEKIKNGKLDTTEWARLEHNVNNLYGAPIYIDDTPSLSVFELRSKALRLHKEHGVRCIIIDYLQLMNASGMNFGSREQEVSIISRNLKALAKELNIPIIALSQLNRQVETRGGSGVEGKRPQLSDLRESGAIEQDADMVCFIHRPEYYRIYADGDGHDLRGKAYVIVAKHRSGKTGDVLLRFNESFTKFMNIDDISSIDYKADDSAQKSANKENIPSKMNNMEVDDGGDMDLM